MGTTTEGVAQSDDLTIATSGDTGITVRSGTSGNGNLFFSDGTSGTDEYRGYVQYDHSANELIFGSDATARMRIDSSGRLLLGTETEGDVNADNLTIADSGNCGMTIRSGTSSSGGIFFSDGTSGDAEYRGQVYYDHNSDYMRFSTAASERMRINDSGNMEMGTNSPTDHNSFTRILDINGSGGGAVYCRTNGSSSNVAIFGQSGSDVYVINKISAAISGLIYLTLKKCESTSQGGC